MSLKVFVEHCVNCAEHAGFTRHKEEKYTACFDAISESVCERFPDAIIFQNPGPSGGYFPVKELRKNTPEALTGMYMHKETKKMYKYPRLGSFEISYSKDGEPPVLIYSKLQCKQFPSAAIVAKKLQLHIDDQPLMSPLPHQPPKDAPATPRGWVATKDDLELTCSTSKTSSQPAARPATAPAVASSVLDKGADVKKLDYSEPDAHSSAADTVEAEGGSRSAVVAPAASGDRPSEPPTATQTPGTGAEAEVARDQRPPAEIATSTTSGVASAASAGTEAGTGDDLRPAASANAAADDLLPAASVNAAPSRAAADAPPLVDPTFGVNGGEDSTPPP